MVNFLENRKRVFWEALLLTLIIFIFGILIGVAFESTKVSKINEYYAISEASLLDAFALNSVLDMDSSNCDLLSYSNIHFANNIYDEAVLLEKYESSGKITKGMEMAHKKYDMLRTLLWINYLKTKDKCGKDYSSVIYLYEYNTDDLTQKAMQSVWSKILVDLKNSEGDNIILIPIAVDSEIISLNLIIHDFNITNYPVLIIDEKHIIYDLSSTEELGEFIN